MPDRSRALESSYVLVYATRRILLALISLLVIRSYVELYCFSQVARYNVG